MRRAAWPCLVVVGVMLLVLTPAVHADLGLFSSSSSNSGAGSSNTAASTEEKGSRDGEHHPQIIVTGAEVGVEESPEPAPGASSPGPSEPTEPTLLGDLISAASGESNGTIAQVLDKALAKEFAQESKNAEEGKGRTFNETVNSEEGAAKVETVVRISAGKRSDEHASDSTSDPAANATSTTAAQAAGTPSTFKKTNSSSSGSSGSNTGSSGSSSGSHAEKESSVTERGVDRIIDSQDNEFVLSAPPKDQVATLTLDPLLIQDLTLLFASAAVMGMVFESIGQPVINGYLVAGAIVGPGGLQLIKELVQVESLAQLGVQLLLFHLGRELSFSKLKAVWSVALVGGALQIVALSALGGVVAAMMESPVTQGIFVGALLSMSSTSVVVKCLDALRMNGTAFGQIVIGTLILQDCSVGIMFALMPAFGTAAAAAASHAAGGAGGTASSGIGAAAWLDIAVLVCIVLVKLLLLVAASFAVARLVLPTALQLLLRYASGELVQLSLVSLCLCSAWLCGQLGLSEELGAFMAGAMMALAEQRLVASGHMVPSSAPHSPGSKGHLSEPDSPTSITPAVLPKSAAPKHNTAAVAYYRHATQRQVPRGPTEQQSSRGSYHDTESGDVIAAVHDLDSTSLTAQLHDLHHQQHVALLAGQQQQPSGGGIGPIGNSTSAPGGSPRAGSEVHGPSVMANIESIQNVLTALFVASMGLIMSPMFLWHHASVLLTGALVVMLLKAAVVTLVVRMFDVPLKLSLAVGLSMAHIGEFSFVLLSMANQLKLLSSQVYMLLLGVTAMSLLTTPVVIMGSIRFLAMAKEGHHQIYITGPRLRLSCDRE